MILAFTADIEPLTAKQWQFQGSLMMACSEGILWKESLQLLSEMSTLQRLGEHVRTPSLPILYSTRIVLCNCCRCLPDLFSYSTVISTCGAADEWQLALSLYQDLMQDLGVARR